MPANYILYQTIGALELFQVDLANQDCFSFFPVFILVRRFSSVLLAFAAFFGFLKFSVLLVGVP